MKLKDVLTVQLIVMILFMTIMDQIIRGPMDLILNQISYPYATHHIIKKNMEDINFRFINMEYEIYKVEEQCANSTR